MSKCLYVGNLSWEATSDDLRELLVGTGEIVSAEVQHHPDGRSKGWGLVEFADEAGAASAIAKYNDHDLLGRKIFLREDRETGDAGARAESRGRGRGRTRGRGLPAARGRGADAKTTQEPPAEAVPGTTLYVGNLPWSTKWADLKDLFVEYNVKFADVKLGFDGRSRGYGIVRFDTEEDAAAALVLNGSEVEGRSIVVRYDRQGPAEAE